MIDTDLDWEYFARSNPYWAVLTDDAFRTENLTEQAREEFFRSGERDIDNFFEVIRRQLVPEFSPRSALDFGCGVGRLSVALAARAERVVGVDVSLSMLREAASNLRARGVVNVQLLQVGDSLDNIRETFDVVLTYIVLQHVSAERGLRIFERLVELIAPGGVGVIHLTYSKNVYAGELLEHWPSSSLSNEGALVASLQRALRVVAKRARKALRDVVRGRPHLMQMNPYTLNPIFHTLQRAGVRSIHAELTDHGGELGTILFFLKPA